MEPITTLAATAISVLTPYVAKGAEEFVKAAGKEAYEKAKQLFAYVKGKFSSSEEAAGTLSLYEKNPSRHEAALKDILREEMEKDDGFAKGLSRQLKEIGPYIEVIQKMEKGEGIVGVEAEEINSGRVNVQQEIKDAKDIKGGVFKRIG